MAQRMSAAEWIKQKELERKGIYMPAQSSRQMAPMQQMQQMQQMQPMQPMQPMPPMRPMQQMQQMPPMQPMRPSLDPVVTDVLAGIDRTIKMQEEGRKRNAFIERSPREGPAVRLSSLPEYTLSSPEMKQIIAATKPGFYKADGNTYYKSVTGKIQYISPPKKYFPGETINPQYPDGAKIVNTRTHKTGKIDRFRRMERNTPYYSVTYDDGSSESFEPESNLLRN
jgi:hypothetical protein